MTQEHPIAFLSESLVLQWSDEWYKAKVKHMTREKYMCMQAAQWGADHELEACCEILRGEFNYHHLVEPLRAARRPKPTSLKEEVKAIIDCLIEGDCLNNEDETTLLRALEQLDD